MKKVLSITLGLALLVTSFTSCIWNQKHADSSITETTVQNITGDSAIQDAEIAETEYRYDEAYPNSDAAPASDFEYETENKYGGIKITKYIGTDSDIVIPQMIDEAFVTIIGYGAFYELEHIETVTMPNCVVAINAIAFSTMPNLSKIHVSKNLRTVGMMAFSNTPSLKEVDLSMTSVTVIPRETFCESGIEYVKFNDQLETIAEYAFRYCNSLKEIILPKNLKILGEHAFADCRSVEKIFIPKSITTYGLFPFERNTSVTEIVFEEGILSIAAYSLWTYGGTVESVIIPAGVESIGDGCFDWYDSKLKSIYFEGNAPNIGSFALGDPTQVTIYYDPSTQGWEEISIKNDYHMEVWAK